MINTKTNWKRNTTAIGALTRTLGEINPRLDSWWSEEASGSGKPRKDSLLEVFVYQFQSGHVYLVDIHQYHLDQAVLVASQFFWGNVSDLFNDWLDEQHQCHKGQRLA